MFSYANTFAFYLTDRAAHSPDTGRSRAAKALIEAAVSDASCISKASASARAVERSTQAKRSCCPGRAWPTTSWDRRVTNPTMGYPAVKERFQQRQKDLREARDALPRDYTLELATRRIMDLEAQVKRLEETNGLLLDQFRRWQYNAFANNIRMDLLALEKPLPEVDRAGKPRKKKTKK